MSDLYDQLPPLRDVIAAYNLRAKKSLGQNFLTDPGITDRIAAAAGDVSAARLVEIGPGPGGLTRSLLRTSAPKIAAIEFDPRAIELLGDLKQIAGDRLDLIHGDALHYDYPSLMTPDLKNVIIANLPYNISAVLLAGWLGHIRARPLMIDQMILMFQKEVADRLMAKPSTPDYGRLSVLTQWLCRVDSVMVLPPGAFIPPPKVYSSVVRLIPRVLPGDAPTLKTMDHILTMAFAHRRKMLRRNLKPYLDLLDAVGIDPTDRAEDVSVDTYIQFAQHLEKGQGR